MEQSLAGKTEEKKIQMTSTADIINPAIFWLLYPAVRKTGFISRNIVLLRLVRKEQAN